MKPGNELIINLERLRKKLEELRERLDSSGVERTYHLRRIMGDDCSLYQKSMNLFIDEDYEELRDMTRALCELFSIIEGDGNE